MRGTPAENMIWTVGLFINDESFCHRVSQVKRHLNRKHSLLSHLQHSQNNKWTPHHHHPPPQHRQKDQVTPDQSKILKSELFYLILALSLIV